MKAQINQLPNATEHLCPGCNGTRVDLVRYPVAPGLWELIQDTCLECQGYGRVDSDCGGCVDCVGYVDAFDAEVARVEEFPESHLPYVLPEWEVL